MGSRYPGSGHSLTKTVWPVDTTLFGIAVAVVTTPCAIRRQALRPLDLAGLVRRWNHHIDLCET